MLLIILNSFWFQNNHRVFHLVIANASKPASILALWLVVHYWVVPSWRFSPEQLLMSLNLVTLNSCIGLKGTYHELFFIIDKGIVISRVLRLFWLRIFKFNDALVCLVWCHLQIIKSFLPFRSASSQTDLVEINIDWTIIYVWRKPNLWWWHVIVSQLKWHLVDLLIRKFKSVHPRGTPRRF